MVLKHEKEVISNDRTKMDKCMLPLEFSLWDLKTAHVSRGTRSMKGLEHGSLKSRSDKYGKEVSESNNIVSSCLRYQKPVLFSQEWCYMVSICRS